MYYALTQNAITAVTTIEVQILVSFADIAILILNKCIKKKGHKLEFDFEFVEEFSAGSSDETATEECETEYVLNVYVHTDSPINIDRPTTFFTTAMALFLYLTDGNRIGESYEVHC